MLGEAKWSKEEIAALRVLRQSEGLIAKSDTDALNKKAA